MGGCNREGYPDPTAGIAIGRVMKQEKRKKEGGKEGCSYRLETQEWTKSLTVRI